MKKYPKIIYVVRENEGTEDEFLTILEKPIDVDLSDESERKVMVYQLTSHCTVTKEIKVK